MLSFIAMTVSLLGSLGVGVPDSGGTMAVATTHITKKKSAEDTWWNPWHHLTKFLHCKVRKPKWIVTNTANVMGQPPACQIYIWSRVRGNLTIRSQAATAGFGAVKMLTLIPVIAVLYYRNIAMGFPDPHRITCLACASLCPSGQCGAIKHIRGYVKVTTPGMDSEDNNSLQFLRILVSFVSNFRSFAPVSNRLWGWSGGNILSNFILKITLKTW